MESFKSVSTKWVSVVVLLVILMSFLPIFVKPYTVVSITSILMYITLAVSWAMFCAPTGYISLATATFFGVGIYASAVLSPLLPLPLVVASGGLLSFFFGLLVGLISLRLAGFYFAIFTFGLSELTRNSVLWWEHNISITVGRRIPLVSGVTVYYFMLGIVLITVLVSYLIKHSKFGVALESIGECEDAAAHIGINVTAMRITFFSISCLFMGMTGAIMATKWSYIDPNSAFNPVLSFTPVLMSLFGGAGQIYGPVLGAGILTFISEILLSRFPYHYALIYGMIFIVVIIFLPSGLVGLFKKWQKRSLVD
jgi:branched-chain amino acid transport system permease protein